MKDVFFSFNNFSLISLAELKVTVVIKNSYLSLSSLSFFINGKILLNSPILAA